MKNKFVIFNSHTSGVSQIEMINGREHIVTDMVSIVGDTVMNGIMYPLAEVQKALPGLNMIPAPAGHPVVNGTPVSAAHPLAMNAHNIGGFIRNPVMDGKKVVNQFCLDTQVANKSDDGKKLLKKIRDKEKVGVSTGLNLNIKAENGVGDDGKAFEMSASDLKFDHCAVFVNGTKAAGDHVGTELVFNGAELIINELSVNTLREDLNDLIKADVAILPGTDRTMWVHVRDIFPETKRFIYEIHRDAKPDQLIRRGYSVGAGDVVSLLDDAVEVERIVEFVPIKTDGTPVTNKETSEMKVDKTEGDDKTKDVENASADPQAPTGVKLSVNELAEQAKDNDMVLVTNEDAATLKHYRDNQPAIDSVVAQHNAELDGKRKAVADHLGLNEEDAKGLTEVIINQQFALLPKQDYSLGAGGTLNSQKPKEGEEVYSFLINHDQPKKEGDQANGS